VALINAIAALDGVEAEGDIKTGVAILRRALEEPLRGIAANAGLDGAVVIDTVRRLHAAGQSTAGYDVIGNDYGDMLIKGIIDPAKVTRSAVENAASIAGMILTTDALISDKPEASPAGDGMSGGMGGMDY
jgi:chaperonin GroEL